MRIIKAADEKSFCFFFFNETATTEIYTLSLHDALPISRRRSSSCSLPTSSSATVSGSRRRGSRSEEHTSELQSRGHLVCRLLLEKKNRDCTDIGRHLCSCVHVL